MLCSKLHCQKGFKLKPFFYKIVRTALLPPPGLPRLAELGTNKPVKARFWPWLEPFSVRTSLKQFKSIPPPATVTTAKASRVPPRGQRERASERKEGREGGGERETKRECARERDRARERASERARERKMEKEGESLTLQRRPRATTTQTRNASPRDIYPI